MGGSILNSERLVQASIEFSAMFTDALKIINPRDAAIAALARDVKTNTKVTVHNWLGDVPPFQLWKDERPIGKVAAEGYEITTKKYANGLEVDEDDLEDDNLGLYAPKIQALAEEANVLKINLLMELLASGFGTTLGTGYDGVAFFSDAHPNMSGANQSNLLHASLDDSGALFSALQKMVTLKNVGGKPTNYYPTVLIYGPKNEANAQAALNSQFLANGASNPTYKLVTPVMSPMLVDDWDDYWFLADTSRAMKALIWQLRRETKFRSVGARGPGDTSYENFLTGKLYYGADIRAAAGYGLWQTIVGSDGTS